MIVYLGSCIYFEVGSHYIVQIGLKLKVLLLLCLSDAGVASMSYYCI